MRCRWPRTSTKDGLRTLTAALITSTWRSWALITWRPHLSQETLLEISILLHDLTEEEPYLLLRKLRRSDTDPKRQYPRGPQ